VICRRPKEFSKEINQQEKQKTQFSVRTLTLKVKPKEKLSSHFFLFDMKSISVMTCFPVMFLASVLAPFFVHIIAANALNN
jgi:hypothetical protein